MGWKEPDHEPKPFDASLYKDEGHWNTAYPDSQDRWIADFKPYYELVGVYGIEESRCLYRFERVEALKSELSPYSPRFYNVTIITTEKKDEPS